MVSRTKQQLGGLLVAVVSASGTIWNWHLAWSQGYFYPKSSVFFPACLVLGIAMILFPDYRAERLARGEDISKLQGWHLITGRWWTVVAVGLVAGFANFLALER